MESWKESAFQSRVEGKHLLLDIMRPPENSKRLAIQGCRKARGIFLGYGLLMPSCQRNFVRSFENDIHFSQVLMASDGGNYVGNNVEMSSQVFTLPTNSMTVPRDTVTRGVPNPEPSVANRIVSQWKRRYGPLSLHTDESADLAISLSTRLGVATPGANMQRYQNPASDISAGIWELLNPFKDSDDHRKKQLPKIFKESPVPPKVLDRFNSFKRQIEPALAKYLKAESSKINMFWGMYMVGLSQQDAKPTSVFYSDRKVAKRIHAFFKQSHLQETMKKSATDFPIHYTLQPPRQLSDDANKVSIWVSPIDHYSAKTCCGMPIMSTFDQSSARATIGGIVLIDGTLFGMTVDHVISRLVSARDETSQSGDSSVTDSSFEDFAIPDPAISQLGLDNFGNSTTTVFDLSEARTIASVDMSDLWCRKGYSYLDWALLQLPPDFYLPNVIEESKMTWSKENSSEHYLDIIGIETRSRKSVREVIIMSGNHYKPAVLRPHSASLLMSPGTDFTDILTLSPRKGYGKHNQSFLHS